MKPKWSPSSAGLNHSGHIPVLLSRSSSCLFPPTILPFHYPPTTLGPPANRSLSVLRLRTEPFHSAAHSAVQRPTS